MEGVIEEMTRPELVGELKKRKLKGFTGMKVAELKELLKKETRSQRTIGVKWMRRKEVERDDHDETRCESVRAYPGNAGDTISGTDTVEEVEEVFKDAGEEAGRDERDNAAHGDSGQKGGGGDLWEGEWG